MNGLTNRFGGWLDATMRHRGLSQADVARIVGVADAQVSRWRRGQVVPSVRHLQRIAETFDVPRATLEPLAGYPSDEPVAGVEGEAEDPERWAELQAYQVRHRRVLEQQLPRELWQAYVEACEGLAEAMGASFRDAVDKARSRAEPPAQRNIGFRPRESDPERRSQR